jgi:hypothetical protein
MGILQSQSSHALDHLSQMKDINDRANSSPKAPAHMNVYKPTFIINNSF